MPTTTVSAPERRESRRFDKLTTSLGRVWTNLAERHAAWLFVGPPLTLLILLITYPTLHLLRLAFSRYDIAFMEEPQFNGFQNITSLLTDANFLHSVGNTFSLSISAVAIEFIVGLGLALLLYEPLRGTTLVKPLLIIPLMIPPVVVGLNFRLILDTFGPANGFLHLLGLSSVDWLGQPGWARLSVVLTDLWQWSPFVFLILLAALNAIPTELIDAARVDGASPWALFRYVMWPMILPAIAVALTFRFVDALKLFDIVYMLTYGGPADATYVVALYVYRTAFRFGRLGYAAAMGLVILIFSSLGVWALLKVLRLERRLGWEG
jgi:multiple sugar transport system permease protein